MAYYKVIGNSTIIGDTTVVGTLTGTDVTSTDDLTAGDDAVITDRLTVGGLTILSATSTITANADANQANATALTTTFNRVTTVGGANHAVKLPTGVAGMIVEIENAGANNLRVFGQTGAAIDAGVANAAYVMVPGSAQRFEATSATQWRSLTKETLSGSLTLPTGDLTLTSGRLAVTTSDATIGGVLQVNSYTNHAGGVVVNTVIGLSAQAAGVNTNGTSVSRYYSRFSTVATHNDSATLTAPVAVGEIRKIKNRGNKDIALYPASGGTIGELAANAPIYISGTAGVTTNPGSCVELIAVSAADWSVTSEGERFQDIGTTFVQVSDGTGVNTDGATYTAINCQTAVGPAGYTRPMLVRINYASDTNNSTLRVRTPGDTKVPILFTSHDTNGQNSWVTAYVRTNATGFIEAVASSTFTALNINVVGYTVRG